MRTARVTAAVLAALTLACGASALRHVNGRDLAPALRFAAIERGWIAIDSCPGGIHAVVELEVDSVALRDVPSTLAGFGRALGARSDLAPAMTVEGPWCRYARVPRATRSPERERPPVTEGRICTAVYVVRAQYALGRFPAAGERLTLIQRDRPMVVRWEAR